MTVLEPPRVRDVLREPADERETFAQQLYERLHPAMGVLGLLFVLVVLGQRAAQPGSGVATALVVVTWLLWAVFALEYVVRAVIAPKTGEFLKRTWWQLLFLVVPFLSMVRVLLFLRLGRPTRVLLAAVRGTRSARARLSSRALWLGVVTAIVVFSAADLVYEFGDIRPYGNALHAAAMAAIAGESMPSDRALTQVLDVVLAVYAVLFFASLAAAVGAYLLEPDRHVEAG